MILGFRSNINKLIISNLLVPLVLQGLQRQPSGTHFLVLLLKTVREHASLISLGILFHILAAILAMDSVPKCVEWMFDLDRQ